jgi:two-component system LytT family response regulator
MKRIYTAIVVDDERLARRDLISMLRQHESIEVVGEADDVPSAARAIRETAPQLVFLDIQLPGRSGFDLLPDVPADCRVIFVTAHDEYAIRAFEVNALDYLLKPVRPERLAQALARLSSTQGAPELRERPLDYEDSIYLRVDRSMTFLKIRSILGIRAAGDYSEVVTVERAGGLTDKTMGEWEWRLPQERFCRIHRSGIVNLAYVVKVEEAAPYAYSVHLRGIQQPFPMSRRYAARLKHRLS